MRYQRKPSEIEAIKWTGENISDIVALVNRHVIITDNKTLLIPTSFGDQKAEIGDMVIKGVLGDVYPCKSDVFDASYVKVE